MKSSIVAASVLLLAALCATAFAHGGHGPKHGRYPSICFKKTQRCCFVFRPCGVIYKKVRYVRSCGYKKCYHVCKKVCKVVRRYRPKKICRSIWKRVHVCKKIYYHGKYIVRCKHKYIKKTVCKIIYRPKYVKICKRKCYKYCVVRHAYCVYYKVFRYIRYCTKVSCGRIYRVGYVRPPHGYVGKKGLLLKVIKGKRYHGKYPGHHGHHVKKVKKVKGKHY